MPNAYSFKYKYNLELFTNEDDLSFYLLGAAITDGCITESGTNKSSYRFSFSSADFDWIESIKNLICPEMKLIDQKTYHSFRVSSKKICE